MGTEAKNLWGELPDVSDLETPRSILRKQMAALERMSNGLLLGSMEIHPVLSGGLIIYFNIVVPSLNNYTYRLLTIKHPLVTYPLEFSTRGEDGVKICANLEEFVENLQASLSSKETQEALLNLLSLAKS